jgi:hypothetical protein
MSVFPMIVLLFSPTARLATPKTSSGRDRTTLISILNQEKNKKELGRKLMISSVLLRTFSIN